MKENEKDRVLIDYLRRVKKLYSTGDAMEASFYSHVGTLLERIWKLHKIGASQPIIMPKRTEGGLPDMVLKDNNNLVVGYVEAKAPFKELESLVNSEQIQRYLTVFPNFILTNFLEFRLFRHGKQTHHATLATLDSFRLSEPEPKPLQQKEFMELMRDFICFSMPVNTCVKELAEELARRTRYMRDHVVIKILEEEPDSEDENTIHIHGLYAAFKTYLIHGLSKREFADLYSQTLTFGLFTAATQNDCIFNMNQATHFIPPTNGILLNIFQFISMGKIPDELSSCLNDIITVIASMDPRSILHTYYNKGKGADPVLHFYETFLTAYDPTVREKKGVYYTPAAVVNYIVRSLDIILKTHLDKTDGLADKKIKILDPASGTSTFLAAIAELVTAAYGEKYGTGAQAGLVRDYLVHNLYGFEEMMAPYAVGHLKMLYLLEKLGIKGGEPPRFNLYLTNTLEMENIEQSDLPGMHSLSKESQQAGKVKKETPIFVIVGNPPYAGHSSNESNCLTTKTGKKGKTTPSQVKEKTWIGSQIEDYKRIDGNPLNEKNPKWLQDDYVKFIRFAQYMIDRNGLGEGVIGFITNHGYLDNPTFRGMRRSLMNSFNEIYILNLHGNVAKKEKCPDGTIDENIFDIRQGTAISFFIKKKAGTGPCRVFYAEIQGSRQYKYELLNSQNFDTTAWQEIHPETEFYLFTPRAQMNRERYASFFKVTDIFPVYSVAIITARDALTIATSQEELFHRVKEFAAADETTARQQFDLGEDTRDWQVKDAQYDLQDSGPDRGHITPILYRPFDLRYTYYTGKSRGFLCMPRPEVMRHMLHENIALITVRQVAEGTFNHCMVSDTMAESRITTSNKGIAYLFPLYLYLYPFHHPVRNKKHLFSQITYLSGESSPRRPNIAPHVLHWWREKAGFPNDPTPEHIFYYIYAILFSTIYRENYAEGLKIDFPRIPFTTDYTVFMALSKLGEQLSAWHLLKSPDLDHTFTKFEVKGNNQIKAIEYYPELGRVFINQKQYFSNISPELWEYHWTGYQVLWKWLKDRRGNRLSGEDILHFIKMTCAIHLTQHCQTKIDVLYRELEEKLGVQTSC